MNKIVKIACLLVLIGNSLFAQNIDPTDSAQSEEGDFQLMVYGDAYYSWDSSEPLTGDKQYVTQAQRHNEFNINLQR